MQTFTDLLIKKFPNTDSTIIKEYIDYIETHKMPIDTPRDGRLYEAHHILPRSLFPDYESDPSNIVKLKLFDHFVAHYILAKTKNSKMIYALNCMNRIKGKINNQDQLNECAKMYSEFRTDFAKLMSEMERSPMSEEHRIAMSKRVFKSIGVKEVSSGKSKRVSTEEYHSNPEKYVHHMQGKSHSKETKQLMSENSGNKNKFAFTHRTTGIITYQDESFNDLNYIKGDLVMSAIASKRFKGDSHWTNTITGESLRSKECPGENWIKKRSNFKNVFSDKIPVVNILTGEKEIILKSEKQIHHCVWNATIWYNDVDIHITPKSPGDGFTKTNAKTFVYKNQAIK